MRVLHVIASLSPVYGGPSVAVVEMCRALRSIGVDAEIVATNADGSRNAPKREAEKLAGDGIPVHIFSRIPPYAYMTSPSMALWLARHAKDYQVIHVHAIFSHPTTLGCQWARFHRIPYIIRPLGLLDPWCLNQNRFRKRIYWAMADRSNLRHAAAIHFTSDAEKDEAQWVSPAVKRAVIPLGAPTRAGAVPGRLAVPGDPWTDREGAVPRQKQIAIPNRHAFLKEHRIPSNCLVILFLSRINPKKGFDVLVPALGKLKKSGVEFRLLVAGPDENGYRADVEKMVAEAGVVDRVQFLGLVSGVEKESLLEHSDLFVLPSHQENFAIAAVEAMQRGLPVMISDRVGIHTYVSRWKAGEVVRGLSEAWAARLRDLLGDPARMKELGRNGIRLVEAEFSWHDSARQLERLYQEITGARSNVRST